MADIPLRFPLRGISDDRSFEDQEQMTTREALNVRAVDPKTGRTRGAQRSGLSKLIAMAANGTNKVQHIATVSYDQPRIDYTALDADTIETVWSKVGPAQAGTFASALDREGNLYVLDGPGSLIKYNPDGEQIVQFPLPLEADDQEARTLAVDDFLAVYVGVGGSTQLALQGKVYKFEPDDKVGFREAWAIDTQERVRQIVLQGDSLWVLSEAISPEFTTEPTGYLSRYVGVTSPLPVRAWQRAVPYPTNGMALNAGGDAFTAHEANAARALEEDVKDGYNANKTVSWTPYDLTDYENRIFFWVHAATLGASVGDEDEVRVWQDRRNYDALKTPQADTAIRNLEYRSDQSATAGAENAMPGPKFIRNGVNGEPALRFHETSYVTRHVHPTDPSLVEYDLKAGTTLASRGSWRTDAKGSATETRLKNLDPVPGWEGSTWATFIVLEMEPQFTPGQGNVILQYDNPNGLRFGLRLFFHPTWTNAKHNSAIR